MKIKSYIKKKLKAGFPGAFKAYYFYLSKKRYKEMCQKVTKFGFLLKGMPAMQDGTFEPEETELIVQALKKNDVFIDIGANIGYFSCIAHSKGVQTISVEPLPENLGVLFSNLTVNGWHNAEVYPVGLGEKPMLIDMFGDTTGASVLNNWAGNSELLKRTIPLSTLDIIIGGRFEEKNILIKLDVEGFEYDVLKGATATLARYLKPTWLIEICFDEHHPAGFNPDYQDIFNLFWENGYKAYIADQEQRHVSEEDVKRWVRNKKMDFGLHNFLFKE